MLRQVIFDLDGTLIDSAPGVIESFGTAAQAIFPTEPFDPASIVIGPPLPKMFQAAYPKASEEQVNALVQAFRADYVESGWKKTRMFDGVERTLRDLHSAGRELFVVTNKPLDISRTILAHLDLNRYFADIRSLDSRNPPYGNKAEMLKALVEERHLKTEQCVLVGDTKGDAEAAKALNIPFIWVSFGYGNRTEIAAAAKLVDSFKELRSVLG